MQKPCVNEFEAYASYLAQTDLPDYVYEYVKSWSDAEDVIKEALTIAAIRRDEFDTGTGPDGLRDWLRAICRENSKSYLPFARFEESPVFGDQAHMADYDETEKYEQEHRLWEARLRLFIREDDLTPPQRECFFAEVNGESQTEIARRLGVSVQNVNQHIHYAKKKLNPKNPELVKKQRPRRSHLEADRSRQIMNDLLDNIVAEKAGMAE